MADSHIVTTAARQSAQPRPLKRILLWALGIVGGLLLVTALYVVFVLARMSYVPGNLDLSRTRASTQKTFQATIRPSDDPIPINRIHTWTLHVETADGKPVEDAAITVDGDMPQHGHGMPTRPQVTRYLGNGDYLVEGMKFQMGGWWVVDFTITHNGTSDKASFNLMLKK